jgi:predicted RNase H-like nuclease (RuvC/YqgF family)
MTYKYKSISDLRQSLVLKGARVILKPGDVIESDTPIKSVFLEEVPKDTQVTVNKTVAVNKKVTDLQDSVDSLTESKMAVEELQRHVNELQSILQSLKSNVDDNQAIILKRLEMLKSAIMTLETEIFGEEDFVVVDSK